MHLKQLGITYVAHENHLQNTKNNYKTLKKHEILDINIKMNYTKHVFCRTWLMKILQILQEELLLIKYYLISKNL